MTATQPDTERRPHALYRFYDRVGALLYIGITVNLPTRLRSHHDVKPWWHDIAKMTVQSFPDRESVLIAEKAAIINEFPLHNVQYNGPAKRIDKDPFDDTARFAGISEWTFRTRGGYQRTGPLWLYWEVHCDPISDDWSPEEITAEDLWHRWLTTYPQDENAESIFGIGAFRISWIVEGSATFEQAPLRDTRIEICHMRQHPDVWPDEKSIVESCSHNDFLTHYTWPRNDKTGERLQWSRLPVIDKVWREDNLPSLRAFKGGFIQEATGWKPAPYQPFVDAYQLGAMCGLYVPERGRR